MKLAPLLFFIFFLCSCASGKLIQEFKTPQINDYRTNKILVIGISADETTRSLFENKVVDALKAKGVMAVNSVDFFPNSFTQNESTTIQLNAIESQLLGAGFDTILVAKIVGKESRVSIVDSFNAFKKDFETFEEYYFKNQNLYKKQEKTVYTVYNTETSLFCICPEEERELLWQGIIEVHGSSQPKQTINRYLNTLIQSFNNQNLLF